MKNGKNAKILIIERDQEGCLQFICKNCSEAPCSEACPAGAIRRRNKDEYIRINEEKCVGCNMCVMVCPFNAIGEPEHGDIKWDSFNHEEKIAAICVQRVMEFTDLNKSSKRKRIINLERMSKD